MQAQRWPGFEEEWPRPNAEEIQASDAAWRARLRVLRQGSGPDRFAERQSAMEPLAFRGLRAALQVEFVRGRGHFELVQAALLAERMGGLPEARALEQHLIRREGPPSPVPALALGRIGDARSVPTLVQTLARARAVERRALLFALGRIGSREAARALEGFIRAEPRTEDLEAALLALGASATADLSLLASAADPLRESRVEVRAAAVLGLGLSGPSGVLRLSPRPEEDEVVRRAWFAARARAGGQHALPATAVAIASGLEERRLRLLAIAAAGSEPAAPHLLQALRSGAPRERALGLVLGAWRGVQGIDAALVEGLGAADEEVQVAAALATLLLPAGDAAEKAASRFAAHPSPTVRELGVLAAVRVAEQDLRPQLAAYLALEQPRAVRERAESYAALAATDPNFARALARAELQTELDRRGASPSGAIFGLVQERIIALLDLSQALDRRGSGEAPGRPPRAPGAERRRPPPQATDEEEDLRRHLDAWPYYDRSPDEPLEVSPNR